MHSNVKFAFLIFFLAKFSEASDTTCLESGEHFAQLCFSPKPTMDVDIKWTKAAQPLDGWHVEVGNDIARLHLAELVQGKLLTLQDNFGDTCFRVRIDHGEDPTQVDGTFYGYTNMKANWNCNASMDNRGVIRCDMSSSGLSKYHENINSYTTYSDNKNLQIAIMCFPNGQVGWVAFSITQTLTKEEKQTIKDHIKTLGFSDDNTVTTYTESCSK